VTRLALLRRDVRPFALGHRRPTPRRPANLLISDPTAFGLVSSRPGSTRWFQPIAWCFDCWCWDWLGVPDRHGFAMATGPPRLAQGDRLPTPKNRCRRARLPAARPGLPDVALSRRQELCRPQPALEKPWLQPEDLRPAPFLRCSMTDACRQLISELAAAGRQFDQQTPILLAWPRRPDVQAKLR